MERKTKSTEKAQEKKVTKRTISKKIEKTEKTPVSRTKASVWTISNHSSYQKKENKVSFRVLFLFFFSLAFLLFALYKVFVFWKGYTSISDDDSTKTNTVFSIKNTDNTNTNSTPTNENIVPEEPTNTIPLDGDDKISNDIHLIQDFYSHLMNNEIDDMNQLVDSPLKTSSTWKSHRSAKNIWIFTKHIINDNISLDNISLVPWFDNEEKKTRKYGYTLWYTIDTNEEFNEDWEITLLDRNGKTLISEIMCKTDWSSHSPFFWPQNYGLK